MLTLSFPTLEVTYILASSLFVHSFISYTVPAKYIVIFSIVFHLIKIMLNGSALGFSPFIIISY